MLLSDLCALMNTREGAAMLCVCLFVCFFEDISKTFLGKEIRERETLSKVSTRIHIKKKSPEALSAGRMQDLDTAAAPATLHLLV